jgi:hypothetical protein
MISQVIPFKIDYNCSPIFRFFILVIFSLYSSVTLYGQLGQTISTVKENKGKPYESGTSENGTLWLHYLSNKPHPDGGTYEEASSFFFNDQNICIGSTYSTPLDIMGILIEQFDKIYTKLDALRWKNGNIAIFFAQGQSGGAVLYIGYIDQMSKIK